MASARPEDKVRDEIIRYLRGREWFVKITVGNLYQSGFPDLYCAHRRYGQRWIEVKLPEMKGSKFTGAQLASFPEFNAAGVGVWVLTGGNEYEYGKLFKEQNWYSYLKGNH